jgi:hypothetical protein
MLTFVSCQNVTFIRLLNENLLYFSSGFFFFFFSSSSKIERTVSLIDDNKRSDDHICSMYDGYHLA